MRGSSTAWVRGVTALVTLLTVLTFSAPPSVAGELSPPAATKAPEPQRLAASAAAVVATMAPPPALAQDSTPAATTSDSGSFFRSPKGVAAIVMMVAGAAYVAYKIPKDNEKVHSPIR